ncbi:MAG: beta-galactosidase [bacterium]|nr:beta-galactosidase [bacterium]
MFTKPPTFQHRLRRNVLWLFFGLMVVLSVFFLFLNYPTRPTTKETMFGVTFSPYYMQEFGVDWKKAYTAILDDLGVRDLRLSAYWNHTEPSSGSFDFSDLDYQLDQAALRNAHVILAVGRKLPRWPECHDPEWITGSSRSEIEAQLLTYVDTVVQKYKDHPAVTRWQIENEPFFWFGVCDKTLGLSTLKKEIAIVRKYSPKPIVVTDSGEWSFWLPAAWEGDVLGISMYRESWNALLGRIPFPISPGFYQKKADIISPVQKNIIVTELQAEPWGEKPIAQMTREEMTDSMDIAKFESNVSFSQQTGFGEVYLWGVEWWYWMKTVQGDSSFWDTGREIFNVSHQATQ